MPYDTYNSYRLESAIAAFRPFFGLSSFTDLVSELEIRRQIGNLATRNRTSQNTFDNSVVLTNRETWIPRVFDLVLNTIGGAYPVNAPTDGDRNNLRTLLRDFATSPVNTTNIPNVTDAISFYAFIPGHSGNRLVDSFFYPSMPLIIGTNPQPEEQSWKRIVAAKINGPYLNPALKNVDLATVFFNGMPSVELNRCSVFLDARFVFGRSTLDRDGRINAPSIYKFLLGAKQLPQSGVERDIVLGSAAANTGSMTGMELFSTPQTLINAAANAEANSEALRAVPVLDPNRPFLTLKGIAIDVQPTVGFFSNKTAKMELVLHDRSRMHEIAEFVKPDFRSSTEIVLNYGWIHPDGPEVRNPYADMINGSRIVETYKIRNSSFSFAESGEVNISLDLFTAGTHDLNTVTITEASTDLQRFTTITATLREAIAAIQGGSEGSSTQGNNSSETSRRAVEIRGIQTLTSVVDSQNFLRLSQEQARELANLRQDLRNRSNNRNTGQTIQAIRRVAGALDQLFGPTGTSGGSAAQLRGSIVNNFREISRPIILSNPAVDDPFYPTAGIDGLSGDLSSRTLAEPRQQQGQSTQPGSRRIESGDISFANGTGVSLAKILLNFVAKPLAATQNYEEVQLLFYPFNEYAGYASRINIGELPINKRFFAEQYLRFRMETITRSANMTLQDFVGWLASTIIDDMGNPAYGISDLFRSTAASSQNRALEAGTEIRDTANFQIRLEERLRNVTPNGDFKHPQVQCYVEALPVRRATTNNPGAPPDFTKKVLRLHFFDRQSTAYSSQASILQASRAYQLSSFGRITPPADSNPGQSRPTGQPNRNTQGRTAARPQASTVLQQRRQQYQQIIEEAVRVGLIRAENSTYRVVGGQAKIKEFMYSTMPYIIYGAQGTTINTAQLASQQNELLGSVNMIRSLQASPINANGEQPGGLPLQIIPAELSVNMRGCTLVDIFQQYYIDFNTGTSLDNIYVVNGVTHKIDPGNFSTDIKFVFYDGYGQYRSFLSNINNFRDRLAEEERTITANSNQQQLPTPRRRTQPRTR
jgi:hypothetical protein